MDLNINVSKTKFVVFRCQQYVGAALRLNGHPMKRVNTFRYQGNIITCKEIVLSCWKNQTTFVRLESPYILTEWISSCVREWQNCIYVPYFFYNQGLSKLVSLIYLKHLRWGSLSICCAFNDPRDWPMRHYVDKKQARTSQRHSVPRTCLESL